jgi:hypothetical protein
MKAAAVKPSLSRGNAGGESKSSRNTEREECLSGHKHLLRLRMTKA